MSITSAFLLDLTTNRDSELISIVVEVSFLNKWLDITRSETASIQDNCFNMLNPLESIKTIFQMLLLFLQYILEKIPCINRRIHNFFQSYRLANVDIIGVVVLCSIVRSGYSVNFSYHCLIFY